MRIAFVVQRYGVEVNGGAEALCRWVAERMHKYFQVEVLTTCALDYLTWQNHYPAGACVVNGVTVRRFPVDAPRDMDKFNAYARALFAKERRELPDELTWLKLQGPACSGLLAYLRDHEPEYDLFVFVTYSYLMTFLGLQLAPRKSVLIPAAHDEPHFKFAAYQPIFHLPRGIIYCTHEERRIVQAQWQNARVPSCVAGVGVGEPVAPDEQAEPPLALPSPYLLYVGRVDVMKGCRELLTYFLRYIEQDSSTPPQPAPESGAGAAQPKLHPPFIQGRDGVGWPRAADLHLVLLGKPAMEIPAHPQIHAPGFVSNAQKDAAIRQAAFVVNPSEYESLSIMLLEAWQAGVPVLVNGRSDVLVDHCLTSNGGLYYTNYDEFALGLDLLRENRVLRETLGANGKQYVAARYSWDVVEKTYVDFLTQIVQRIEH